ncbi:hypothetical protein HY468_00515 [Candidatus Roizmanbacteria bacterium]|nr:hypothetical protein [Candidatus Roizmanbacteria bacterium]
MLVFAGVGEVYAETPRWYSYEDLPTLNSQSLSQEETYEVHITYDKTIPGTIRIKSVTRRHVAYPRKRRETSNYFLRLVDSENQSLFQYAITIPNRYSGIPPLTQDQKESVSEVVLDAVDWVELIPVLPDARLLNLITQDGQLIDSYDLAGVIELTESTRAFQSSVWSDQALSRYMRGGVQQLLNITFIGDNYAVGQEQLFQQDVDRFIQHLFVYEPFNSRSAELIFHRIFTTSDLGCYHSPTIQRLIVCNYESVLSEITASGAPYDEMVVLFNDSEYGGSGSPGLAVSYNGISGPQVFVHEFGHSFGRLHDEYVLYFDPTADLGVQRNCFSGTPPAVEWNGIVAPSDYRVGCRYDHWYRSSPESIMLTLSAQYFNPVSIQLLNEEIDYYTHFQTADFNRDGVVDIIDMLTWMNSFGSHYFSLFDINDDSWVNAIDYSDIYSQFTAG